jgi:hypothetical protein
MKAVFFLRGKWSCLLLAWCAAALVLTGCATNRTDWNTRIGSYTYDQAVLEFGPPDRIATLTDGTKVGEWLTSRGYSRGSFATYGGFYYGDPWVHYYPEPRSPDHFLRLTFSPDGILQAWRKVYK